jgi:flavin-binding protein dodecin
MICVLAPGGRRVRPRRGTLAHQRPVCQAELSDRRRVSTETRATPGPPGGPKRRACRAERAEEPIMTNHVYSVTEIYGSSEKSVEEAIEGAIATASRSLRHLDWFEVKEIRGHIENGKVAHYQVGLKLGFRYED